MVWSVLGIGTLLNTTQGAQTWKDSGCSPAVAHAYSNFNAMQTRHLQERRELEEQLRQRFAAFKESFFARYHYETVFEDQGEGRVLPGQDGKPLLKEGAESAQHKAARQLFESSERLKLSPQQDRELNELVQEEAAAIKAFLKQNSSSLRDPQVQKELQKQILMGKMKALKLQREHQDQRFRVDMPPAAESVEMVSLGLQELRRMEDRHISLEEASSDQRMILEFEGEAVVKMDDPQRPNPVAKAPVSILQRGKSGPPKQRLEEVFPRYLVALLYQLGIYDL